MTNWIELKAISGNLFVVNITDISSFYSDYENKNITHICFKDKDRCDIDMPYELFINRLDRSLNNTGVLRY